MNRLRRLEELRAEALSALPIAKRMVEQRAITPPTPESVRGFRGLAMQLVEILKAPEIGTVIPPNHLGLFKERLHQLRQLVEAGSVSDDSVASHTREAIIPALEAMQVRGAIPPHPFFRNVMEAKLQEILTRDLEEAEEALNRGLHKCCVVLCGSILEAALYELFRRNLPWVLDSKRTHVPHLSKKYGGGPKDIMSTDKEQGWDLVELIAFAANNGVLDKQHNDHLTKALRDPRNLVHPMAELRRDSVVNQDQAAVSYHVLRLVLDRLSGIIKL